jgi:hypothetical protein
MFISIFDPFSVKSDRLLARIIQEGGGCGASP